MTKTEIQTIENVIRSLKGGRDEITAALNERNMRIWLDTWVIGALECLLPGKEHEPRLALRLSQ